MGWTSGDTPGAAAELGITPPNPVATITIKLYSLNTGDSSVAVEAPFDGPWARSGGSAQQGYTMLNVAASRELSTALELLANG